MTVKTLAQIKDVERLNCLLTVATSFYRNLNMCCESTLWSQGGQLGYVPDFNPSSPDSTPAWGNSQSEKIKKDHRVCPFLAFLSVLGKAREEFRNFV